MAKPSTNKSNDTDDQTADFSHTGRPEADNPAPPEPDPLATGEYVGPGSATAAPDLAADLAAAFGDRYQLETLLGAGGFGSVFRALDQRLDRRVAMKASPALSADPDRLLHEARSLAQLQHPGIVKVFDVAVAGGHCFVVSELLPGPSLETWLKTNRPAPAEAVRIAAEVADALAHAHTKSIVHRDLKPSNVVFAEGHRPVLVDFGLALSDMDTAAERGVIAGTPGFMSPEQAGGRAHRPDGRTDVYGLAATLYAMLCGRQPFRGRSTKEVLRQVLEDDPQPPRQLRPDLPPELERVCLKGMAKLPGDRFTTAADFAEALRRSLTAAPPARSPVPPPAAVSRPWAPAARGSRAERRQVTLLHCSCEAAGGADDDPMEQIAAFQAACAEVVAAQGGVPLQAHGTAFLACFGYPVAREDAPRQAVRAALGICQRAGGDVTAAVGSGPAVVTESPGAPPVVVGDVTAAVGALASQGASVGVSVTDATFRLIDGYFDCEPGGEVRTRGAAAPVTVYRVRAERAVRSRMEAADPARLTPLVGRDHEVALLRKRWELAAEGVRNVILLVADPGLGKSRLVRVLKDVALRGADAGTGDSDSADAAVVEWYCSPYHQTSPFYPVTDYFDRTYQLSREPDPAARLDRLLARLRADGVYEPEDQALFAAMLSVPPGERLPAIAVTPERQKEATQQVLLAWLGARAECGAVLFVVEDLHWVDPSTEALLAQFVGAGGGARVLGLFTFRPEYDPPWRGGAVQTQVALNRLTRSQVAEMVRAQAGAAVIPQATVDQIADRTDGVPLFVEEFTRLIAEGGGAGGLGAAIPATLQDLLLARLDRIASVRDVVQLGAVIGRTFTYAVIHAASDLDETVLRGELDKLVGAGLLFPKGAHPRTTYTFKHALIQDAAYQSLVKKQRQRFHQTVAEKLEQQFPDVAGTQPELLARHFTDAGDAARAVRYWLRAGQRARERSANREAIRHLERGLELVPALPADADRDRLDLQFQTALGTVTTLACGWGAPELSAIHGRARELCDRIGNDAQTFHVTWGQWAWRFLRDELDLAHVMAAEIWDQAKRLDDGYAMEACFAVGCTALFRGDFERNLAHAPGGLAQYDPDRCRFHAGFTGQNAYCTIAAHHSWALVIAGYPERALKVAEDGLRLSRELKDTFSEEFVLYHLGCVQQHLRLGSDARRSGETVVAVAAEHGLAVWTALGTLCRGAGLVMEGHDVEQGLAVIDQGERAYRGTGAEVSLSNYAAARAEGLRAIGRPDAARAAVEEGLALAERTAERFQAARLYDISGGLHLDGGDRAGAEEQFRLALDTARRQQARLWELRAAMNLCRLRAARGDRAGARADLGAVYDWFTEGHRFPDLVEARALLDELT